MAELPDLTKLLALIGAGTDQKALEAARRQLIASQPVDDQLIKDTNKSIQDLRDAYTLANSVLSGAVDIDPADPAKSKGFVPVLIAEGVQVYLKPGGKSGSGGVDVYGIDSVNRKTVETALQAQLKAYATQISTLDGVIKQAQNAPAANADATLKGLQNVLLQTGVNAITRAQQLEDQRIAREERLADAGAAATKAGALALEGTVATMIVQETDGKWYFRQILKNGTFKDSNYNPSDADRAKALYNAPDGSIGSLGSDGTSVNWTYRPPRLTKNGEYTYSTEFDVAKQDYVGKQTEISSPGQKLEIYNGQLYVTEFKDGKITVTKVKDMPTMSEKDRQELEIASRASTTAEKNQLLAAAESGIKVDTAKFALDQAKAAKQTGAEIIAGTLTVVEGLLRSGTPADLAKAQELYQSARKDWEIEKKNAVERRDKAQIAGLRRSGMMFLRGATAVQGGKSGAYAQQMWNEEYNRTPGKEGESYTQRMARSLGLGADLDQNLDIAIPTFQEFVSGKTASVVPAVPVAVAPAQGASKAVARDPGASNATSSLADGKVPVPMPRIDTSVANVRTPVGLAPQTGITDAAGNVPVNTVSYTGTGPGDVPARPLFQGQVAVAPNSVPPQVQPGLNAFGQYLPTQVPTGMASDAALPEGWKRYTPEFNVIRNDQGSTQEGDVNVDEEDPMTKLTKLHARLNGFSAE